MDTDTDTNIYDIIILGGGLSGLRACDLLLKKKKDLKILILEANNKIGGRVSSKEYEEKNWDLSGAWCAPSADQKYVGELIDEIGLKRHTYHAKGKKVMEFSSDLRKTYSILIPPIGILQAIEVQLSVWKLERVISSISDIETSNIPKAKEWDGMSAEDWINQNVRSENAKILLRVALLSTFFEEAKNLSLLYVLLYFRTCEGIMKAIEDKGGAQQDLIVGGTMQLVEYLYNTIGGAEKVKLDHVVESITNYDSFPVKITCANGASFLCKNVLCSIPPPLCKDIVHQPPLPSARQQLVNTMKMDKVIKFFVYYEKCFWKESGYCGEAVSFRDSVQMCYDATLQDGTQPCIVGIFAGNSAELWSKKTKQERKDEVLDFIHKNLGQENDQRYLSPVRYLEINFMEERFTPGRCSNIAPKTNFMDFKNSIRDPIKNLFFCGTDTATKWIGFLDGALESAERAAIELLCKITNNNDN
ncbi:hypothetical protein CYY_001922 [Polysphondylium violaceum]|uniref:Amine oxidase n=1 Tax=Polysphondylium violaceum TaxID=133409 RepID=A0A8J4Q8L0_9MYCE|nr:hypothetical protein CYY_001922 [Polysphondylium violaceum]